MTVYVTGVAQGQAVKHTWDVTMLAWNKTVAQAHGLAFTPGDGEVMVRPKAGTDIGGDTITVTTDGVNITLTAVAGAFGVPWVFEVYYIE